MQPDLIAKYPFLSAAKDYLKSESASYDDLEDAKNFVLDALKHSPNGEPVSRYPPQTKTRGPEAAVKTLTLSRLLLACIGNDFTTQKFAQAKAAEYAANMDAESRGTIAADLLPSLEKKIGGFSLSLADYLKYGRNLAGQEVEKGRVSLSEHQLARLAEDAIAQRIGDTAKMSLKNVPKEIREASDELNALLPRPEQQYKGKILSKQCIQKILKGMGEGKRYYGSFAIAIACVKDNIPKEKAYEILQGYVNNCHKTSQPYTFREAKQVVDWVYGHPTIGFSCSTLVAQGLIDARCPDCVNKRKK